jgi:hypothetical protein
MPNIIGEILGGGASEVLNSIGDSAVKLREAIKGVELDPNKKLEIDAQLAGIQNQAKELNVKFAQVTEEDRDSARKREAALAQAGRKNYIMPILAALAIMGMFWLSYFTFTHDIRERELAFMIVGFAIAIVKDLYGYYFGGSFGQDDQRDIIRGMGNK